MSKSLEGKRVLITGVGVKPVNFIFNDIISHQSTHVSIEHEGQEYKANIGAATALACAQAGAAVQLVARTESKLKIVKTWIEKNVPGAHVEYSAVDLGNIEALRKLVSSIPTDSTLFWVQSVGLGAGTVKVKDDNPYLAIDAISSDVIDAELSVLKNTIVLLQLLLPRFRKQKESKACIVSSMSAVRSYPYGAIHCAVKGSISRFANAAMIELAPEKIYITDIRPGGVDTGMYDAVAVRNTVAKIASMFGTDWSEKAGWAKLASPSSVAEAIVNALSSKSHITSVNLVAEGQWPHEGS